LPILAELPVTHLCYPSPIYAFCAFPSLGSGGLPASERLAKRRHLCWQHHGVLDAGCRRCGGRVLARRAGNWCKPPRCAQHGAFVCAACLLSCHCLIPRCVAVAPPQARYHVAGSCKSVLCYAMPSTRSLAHWPSNARTRAADFPFPALVCILADALYSCAFACCLPDRLPDQRDLEPARSELRVPLSVQSLRTGPNWFQ
jgi:hypothetical protein